MEGKFQTSFIPKKPLTQNGVAKPAHTTNFFSLIAMVVFITTLILAGVIFGYKFYLNSHNTSLKADLKKELSKFEPSLMAELTRLDSRIESTKELLNQHIALSSFFNFLSNSTLKTVRFNNFKYSTVEGNKIAIEMNGQAQSYSAVALQAGEFSKQENVRFIKDSMFTDLNLDKETGNVIFKFKTGIDKSLVSYRNVAPTAEAPVTVSTSTTTIEVAPEATTTPQ